MQVISAKIIDATHLELCQPLTATPGEIIQIILPDAKADGDGDDELAVWSETARQHLLDAYDDEDSVYDNL